MDRSAAQFIETLYQANYRRLYLIAYAILGKRTEAEVAVQEAFVVACQQSEDLLLSKNPVGWMNSTVRHRALHILEDQKRTASLFTSLDAIHPGIEPSQLDGDDSELVEFCQRVVSEDEFAFFLRIANGSATFPEEAQRQNIKLAACYRRFERIREKLRQALSKFYKL